MSYYDGERQRDPSFDIDLTSHHNEQISPLSDRFLAASSIVAHSSPVHEPPPTAGVSDGVHSNRLHDDSFHSSSSTSNSKSSSSNASRSSRLHLLMMHHHHHHSAVNSPMMFSRCTSLGSLSSYDIRSSCNDSYTSECSSIKPSGLISPSDLPDSPPCEPTTLDEEHPNNSNFYAMMTRNNRTLTATNSNHNRTTMMSETVIEKTFVLEQREPIKIDDEEQLDEVIVYAYDTAEINPRSSNGQIHLTPNKTNIPMVLCSHLDQHQISTFDTSPYENDLLFDDDSYRVFNTRTVDDSEQLSPDDSQNEASFSVSTDLPHENLSIITEESSFIDEQNSNDENNSIRILYDFIKKPHWTKDKSDDSDMAEIETQQYHHEKRTLSNISLLSSLSLAHQSKKQHAQEIVNTSISSHASSLSLESNNGNETDEEEEDDDEYDQEKGRQLIQKLIEETLARRSLPTDFLTSQHAASCVLCPSNTPMTTTTSRSASSSSSNSTTASTKSCTCVISDAKKRSSNIARQPQRSQSSPARSSSTVMDGLKRYTVTNQENTVHQTRSSFLRLRQAQQNKRQQQEKRS